MVPGDGPLPYKIAVLCVLFDADGRLLLLHRRKAPNRDLYTPIGGKLETTIGESPTRCAQREIAEEAGIEVGMDRLHLTGIVSEAGYQGETHWLMFLYEVTGAVVVDREEFDEGRLEWHEPGALAGLELPQSDREVIWPLFWKHRGGFFAVHVDCTGPELAWRVEQRWGAGAG
ncbi:MAG: NUDIX domain-containing protein, partial [Planctomycetota bacterium]